MVRQTLEIEVFHKILKSGCRAEEAKLHTDQRLSNLIAAFCILGWRIFWMTMLDLTNPTGPPNLALAKIELVLLDCLVIGGTPRPRTLSHYLTKNARLGGYLARDSDPPPRNMVMWRGMSRLKDIRLGAAIGVELMGN